MNCSLTSDRPNSEIVRIDATCGNPAIWISSGTVTYRSISSADWPGSGSRCRPVEDRIGIGFNVQARETDDARGAHKEEDREQPLFTLSGIEGHTFAPMAKTYASAIAGALIPTFTIAPALSARLLSERDLEEEALVVRFLRRTTRRCFALLGPTA